MIINSDKGQNHISDKMKGSSYSLRVMKNAKQFSSSSNKQLASQFSQKNILTLPCNEDEVSFTIAYQLIVAVSIDATDLCENKKTGFFSQAIHIRNKRKQINSA